MNDAWHDISNIIFVFLQYIFGSNFFIVHQNKNYG